MNFTETHASFQLTQMASLAPINSRFLRRFPAYNQNPISEFYEKTFENQKEFGRSIATAFENMELLHALAVAPTQSGKTGSMVAVIYEFLKHPMLRLPKSNIFLFTGHSSVEWLVQTKERFPNWLHPHIYHRNNLDTMVRELENKKNVLIIVDECHVAAKPTQTLDKLFQQTMLQNNTKMYETNTKVIQFSATPENLNEAYKTRFENAHEELHMDVPDSYLSIDKLEEQGRILRANDLCGVSNIDNLFDINPLVYDNIREILGEIEPLEPSYHIVRTPRGLLHDVVIRNFQHTFSARDDFVYLSEPTLRESPSYNLNTLLQTKPTKHTFIFIKDILRCAKTIHHDHIGILYERVVQKPRVSSIIQGLLGRLTGYHNNSLAKVFSCDYRIPEKEDSKRSDSSSETMAQMLQNIELI